MLKFLGRGSAFTAEHNSAYLTVDKDLILLDCSMTSFIALKEKYLSGFENIYILVTHTHGDHISGIGMLIDYVFFTSKTKVVVVAPSSEVKEDIYYFLSRLEGCSDSWYELLESKDLAKNWMIRSVPVEHTEELKGRCFGYCLNIDGKNVIYTGDTNSLDPFEEYLTAGSVLYTEISAHKTGVHIFCEDIKDKIKELTSRGIKVYLMHLDDEEKIKEVMKDTGAELAPLDKGEDVMDQDKILNGIFEISDRLYEDMCKNESKDHALLFSYLTELGKTIVDADRASFWKWDKRKGEIWTMSATGVDKIVIPDNMGLVGKALREKKTVITNDPYSDPDFNKEVDMKTGYKTKSVLTLPVADINGYFIGALQLINKNDDKGFDPETDPKKLSLAALVCGIALESETFLEESHHDKLTGLKNRMGFYFDFGGRYKDYLLPGSGKTMSLFICDIDKFKRVNDTYGHNAGDDVLAFVAGLVESACSDNDCVYRWGGEEFVMVMRDTDLEGAAAKAEEIRIKLMDSDIEADGNTLRCTMSFGCELFDPEKTIEENISVADGRLYIAKETGRNKVVKEDN
ncbi:MAG: diguanylate cyclase [Saccharofermentans sp.]|nr:diguanylate cyclase [Saccharofermentans sp.]